MRVLRNRLYDLLQQRNHHTRLNDSRTLNNTNEQLNESSSSTSSSSQNRRLLQQQQQQQQQRQTRYLAFYKKSERNFLSAFCSILSIVILTVSLAETRWFYLNGGGCNVNYIGVRHFFVPGTLEISHEPSRIMSKTEVYEINFIMPNGQVLRNCTNRDILIIMRLIIAFIFLAITSSMFGLILDFFGFMHNVLKNMRRNAIFHIITVFLCLFINGFCFWVTERIYEQQYLTRFKKGKRVDVQFDMSYYLIVFASVISVLAAAFTLIRRYPTDEDEQLDRILQEYTGFEDPTSLERSLPASNNSQSNEMNHIQLQPTQEQNYIAPPATPPLPIRSINQQNDMPQVSIISSEPPPPYLDDDTQPLIV